MHVNSRHRFLPWATAAMAVSIVTLMLIAIAAYRSPTIHAQGTVPLTVAVDLQGSPATVKPGEIITQRIQLGYNGPNSIDAVFIQEIPSGVRPITAPVVSALQPQTVTPLTVERRGRTWGWRGKMQPDSRLTVVVVLRVQQCYGDDQSLTFAVNARRVGGEQTITDTATVIVDCPNQSIADIHIEDRIIYPDGSESESSANLVESAAGEAMNAIGRFYLPGAQQKLQITLRNDGTGPLIIGTSGAAKCCYCLTCTVAANVYREDLAVANDPTFRRLLLLPGESQVIEQPMAGAPDVSDPGSDTEYRYGGQLTYCLLTENDDRCPAAGANPQLAAVHMIAIPVRASDLGDAPDSSNHVAGAAAAMPAYTGIQANFPTVFDPATGAEQGPRHIYPQFLHLGRRVSREAEADSGPDQDPINNLDPAADSADLDRGDDGTDLAQWALQHCQSVNVPVQIYISPAAVAWFQQKGTTAYLNSWLDSNRDGDWADGGTCQDSSGQAQITVEHIVIDHVVDIAALGAGLHTISVPTGLINWPTATSAQPAWLRITLSERTANKPLSVGSLVYGDGRGYAEAFRTGETEDYLLRSADDAAAGPDLDVRLAGMLEEIDHEAGLHAAAANSWVVDFRVSYRLTYSNRGSRTANGALLEFQIPEKLVGSQPAFVHAPGIAPNRIDIGSTKISFDLPSLQMGDMGTIIVGWTGCLTCTLTANVAATDMVASDLAVPTVDFDATASVRLNGDTNAGNDTVTTRPSRSLIGAGIGGFYTEHSTAWRQQGVTCQDTVTFAGRGRPGSALVLQIDSLGAQGSATGELRSAAPTTHFDSLKVNVAVGPDGIWRYTLRDLHDGLYRAGVLRPMAHLTAAAEQAMAFDRGYLFPAVYVTIDPSLVVDPMSFVLEDGEGRQYFPPIENRLGNFEIQDFMVRAGGEYRASAMACPNQMIESLQFKVGNVIVDAAPAADDCQPQGSDQCGPWSAKVTIPNGGKVATSLVTAANEPFEIVAATATMDQSFSGTVASGTPGIVRDRAGSPLDAGTVTLFQAIPTSATDDGGVTTTNNFFLPWRGDDFAQSNPLVTAADGAYSFNAPDGIYRLQVERSGYQPYVTIDFEHRAGSLVAADIQLSETITDEADYLIEVSENGFVPATLSVPPGSVIAFVNVDLADHTSNGSTWDSGLLTPGASYQIQLDTEQTYRFGDRVDPSNTGAITVERTNTEGNQIFLPVVVR